MEMRVNSFDPVMTSMQNAKERELEDWAELFRGADERFELQEPIQPPGSHHSTMVVLWNGP